MRMKIGVKIFLFSDDVEEKNGLSITDETRLTVTGRKSVTGNRDGGGGRAAILAESRAGAVDGFGTFLVRSEFALGDVAVVCLDKDMGMFVDVCPAATKSSKIANFIHEQSEETEFAGSYV